MLSFDIETTGLNPNRSKVTIVCTQNFFTGEKKAYEFARCSDKYDEIRQELIDDFSVADSLCAFNGIRFDLPFLKTALKIPDSIVCGWVLKTTDILEQSRLRYKTTFSLNLLCESNKIPQKSGDGLKAIRMAESGDFDGLKEYCEDDVNILCLIYKKRHILLPKLNQYQDLTHWASVNLYVNDTDNTNGDDHKEEQEEADVFETLTEEEIENNTIKHSLNRLVYIIENNLYSMDASPTVTKVNSQLKTIISKLHFINKRYAIECDEISEIIGNIENN